MRLLLCALAGVVFTAAAAYLLPGPSRHAAIMVAVEYLLLFPTAVYAFRAPSPNGIEVMPAPPGGWMLAGFAIVALALSWFYSQGLLIPDEAAYQFQAKTYGLGKLAANAPPGAPERVEDTPLPLYFEHHILNGGKWFSKYPPGWPAVLALPLRLDVGWMVNPLLGIVLLLLMAAITRRLYDTRTAALAIFLMALSPFFLANSVGRMAHMTSGVLLAGACLLCFQGIRTLRVMPFAGMFLLIAAAVQVRPLTAAAVGGTLGVGALWYLRREKIFAGVLAWGMLFGAVSVASMLAYNKTYTGNYTLSPYVLFDRNPLTQPENQPDIDLNFRHIAYHLGNQTRWAVQNTVLYAFPFVFLLAAYAAWREKKHPREARFLAALFVVLVLAHVIQPAVAVDQTSAGYEFVGERYYFEAFFAIAILGARGLMLLAKEWHPGRAQAVALVALFGVLAAGQEAIAAAGMRARSEPFRQVHLAAEKLAGQRYAVFLKSAEPDYVAKHLNLNRPDWEKGSLFFMVDPGPGERDEWACRVGRPEWVIIGFGPARAQVTEEFGSASCAPPSGRSADDKRRSSAPPKPAATTKHAQEF